MAGYRRVNYYELCRLCTSSEGTKIHMFRDEARKRQLITKLQICLPVQVLEEDALPKIICNNCLDKVESFYTFRESCVNAEAVLESYLHNRTEECQKDEKPVVAAYSKEDNIQKKRAQEAELAKQVLKSQQIAQLPHGTALVVTPGTQDGLSNLVHATGIQIISESDAARLQPLIAGAVPSAIMDGEGRLVYLPNQGAIRIADLEAANATHADLVSKTSDGSSQTDYAKSLIKNSLESSEEGSQNNQQQEQHPQTITFTSQVPGQEMLVHFNIKDREGENPLQRYDQNTLQQIGEFLRMNLIDASTIVLDPTTGGIRITPVVGGNVNQQALQIIQQQQIVQPHQLHQLQEQQDQLQQAHHQAQQQAHHQAQQQAAQQHAAQQQAAQQQAAQQQAAQQQAAQQQAAQQQAAQQQAAQQQAAQQQAAQQQAAQQQAAQQQAAQQQAAQQQAAQQQAAQQQAAQQQAAQAAQQQAAQQQAAQQAAQQQAAQQQAAQQQAAQQAAQQQAAQQQAAQAAQQQAAQQQAAQAAQQQAQRHHQQQAQQIQLSMKIENEEQMDDDIEECSLDEDERSGGDGAEDVCEHCGKYFATEPELMTHRSVCSTIEAVVSGAGTGSFEKGADNYGCDICGKTFRRKEHVFQHRKLHTGERPFKCESCNKTYSRKEHLLRHSVSHTGKKLYKCEICGKNFSRKDNLHKHCKTHSVGSYICEVCHKAFRVKYYYDVHMKTHGSPEETPNGDSHSAPPHQCDLCGKGFALRAYLNAHRARHEKQAAATVKEEPLHIDLTPNQNQQADDEKLQHHIQVQHPSQQSDPLGENHIVTLTTPVSGGLPSGLPSGHTLTPLNAAALLPTNLLQQISSGGMVPASSPTSHAPHSAAVIQVQSSAATAFLCSPTPIAANDILETYRRLHST